MSEFYLRGARTTMQVQAQVQRGWRRDAVVLTDDNDPRPMTSKELLESERPLTVVVPKAWLRSVDGNVYKVDLDGHTFNDVQIDFIAEGIGIDGGDLLGDVEDALSGGPALIHQCVDYRSPTTCRACNLLWRVRDLKKCIVSVDPEE